MLLILSIIGLALVQLSNAQDPLVQLPNGWIRGRADATFKNKSYYAFEKIPYAAPPVGNLRFKAPIPPENWKGVLDTLYLDKFCYQRGNAEEYESEDCLFINIFTPTLPTPEDDVSLPVMLFIHGGGFFSGSAMGIKADHIIENDVVFAAINYRLGAFGFLSTQDDIIPGNNGLKDQQLALRWVHNNIHLFGGNPDQITIFGQSAGSASCAYQLLNQANEGLFRGAILQSGTFLSPWAFQRRAREIAFETTGFINETFKTSNDSVALRDFLLTVEPKDLKRASQLYYDSEYSEADAEILQGYYWAPVIEANNPDAFITKKMYGLLQAGNILTVPVLMGFTSEEAIANNKSADVLTKEFENYDANLRWLVPNDMLVTDDSNRTETGRLIRKIYTQGEPFVNHLGNGVRFYSDTAFTRSAIKHAEIYAKLAPTYFYQFSYKGKLGIDYILYPGADDVGHCEDINYLFCPGTGCDISSYPESDQLTAERMVNIWTNFAKYQNPTPEPSPLLQNLTWPQFFSDNGNYLYVNINETLEIKDHPKGNTYSQWVQLYDSLGYNDFDTY